ncbi:MAG: undecaprenyl-phosphate glucose phosphotransferase [Chloroflexi bacterium]|nr:MAG: undecaprenyl-phosphate glucose phosphotransferase [Chloroflexota bacterium]HDN80162.1 undecaprenyl-phosphate glucose phosphotransferase [Chloroflexota bacterium]
MRNYRRWLAFFTALADAIFINFAFAVAYWMRYELEWIRPVTEAYYVPYKVYLPFALVLTLILMVTYTLQGLYDYDKRHSWFDEVRVLITGTATGILVMVAIFFFHRPHFYSRLLFLYAFALIVISLGFVRVARNIALNYLRKRGVGVTRVLIVGAGDLGRRVMRNILAQPNLGYQVVGFVDDNPEKGYGYIGRFKGLGSIDRLPQIIRNESVDEVIITLPWMYHRKILSIMAQCERQRVKAKIVPDLFQMSLSHMTVDDLSGVPLISVREIYFRRGERLIKRAMDIVGAIVGLVLLAPLMLLIALAIKLDSPGPVLFKQVRVGKGGKEFVMYKFRSMKEGAEEEQERLKELNEVEGPIFKLKDDPRCTRVGRILRRLSLDELPQLYNVLRGEMSLVGPRPPLPSEVAQYKEWHKKRLEVSPGMTGLWQVSGRSQLPFDEMVLLDLYYIENWSPMMDIMILLRTIPKVILGNGAY